MINDNKYIQGLLKVVLPIEVFDYFTIVHLEVSPTSIDVHLDELNQVPEEYSQEKLRSKGFHKVAIIQDFPIRERSVYLHVRRRRWLLEESGEVISRNWDTVEQGTRYTKGFASFLKELFGQLPNQ